MRKWGALKSVDEVDTFVNRCQSRHMATRTQKSKTARSRNSSPRKNRARKMTPEAVLSVKDLPNAKLRSVAREFKPAVEEVTRQFDPVDAIKVMLATIQEELVKQAKPKANLAVALGRGMLARRRGVTPECF